MRFIKADDIFGGRVMLPRTSVLVIENQNLLKEIVHEDDVDKNNIQHYEGIITPGFVNAHCHLELSHLKGLFPKHTGLPEFGKNVILHRAKASAGEMNEHMQEADREMFNNGIVAVGDISNAPSSFGIKTKSKVRYHTFIELLGLDPSKSNEIFKLGISLLQQLKSEGLAGSLAPHAPYSTSNELIGLIAENNRQLDTPLSIHNQESEEETKFFEGKKNGFDELYKFLGIDLSWFKAPGSSSLKHYIPQLSKVKSMLVHNTFSREEDLLLAADNHWWCFCPGANEYIENRLPDFSLFAGVKKKICIGTDSLASNTKLDVIHEANLVLANSKTFNVEDLLSAITFNAAEAIGMSYEFGDIRARRAGLNLVKYQNGQLKFLKKII